MQTKTELRGVKERNYIRQWLGGSILALAVLLLSFVLLPTLISEASATQDVSAFASWSPVSLTLDPDYGSSDATSARGNVVFGSITPTSRDTSSDSYGTQRVIKKTIGITSNGTYYTVFLSTSGSDNSLALNVDNTDLSIPAIGNGSTTGVWSNPVAFSASGWGFSVPNTTIPASADSVGTSVSSTPPAFTNTVTGANLNKDLTKALDSSVYNQDIWSAVPSSSSPQQIWKANSTSVNGFGVYENSNGIEVTGDIVNDHFDVYYGIMVDTDVLSGTYENEIVYTALASATSLDGVSPNLSRETYIIANGTEQTLHFDLSSNIVNPTNFINKDNVTVYLVPHSVVAAANYELTSTIKSAANTYTTCTINSNNDITISSNGSGATLTCTSPDNTPADGTGLGEFDYWLHIDDYNYDYLSHYKKNEQDTATVAYIGLQSKLTDSNNELAISEMQEMTGSVCKNTNMWGTGLGSEAEAYDYTGTGTVLFSGVPSYSSTANDISHHSGDDISISSFVLTDNRDNKYYMVRRLADGNCWMVQNLDLNLANFAGNHNLTVDNTDLNANTATTRGYYDPQESLWNDASGNTIAEKLLDYYGFAQEHQFQSGYERNADVAPEYSWFSTYYDDSDTKIAVDENTGMCNVNGGNVFYVIDSEYNAYPRSYDNIEYTYIDMDQENGTINTPAAYHNFPNLEWRSDVDKLSDYKDAGWTAIHASGYVGDYYNFYAGSAESVARSATSSSRASAAKDSICPKGWMLPYGDTEDKSFYYMASFYNATGSGDIPYVRAFQVPISIPATGFYNAGNGRLDHRAYSAQFLTSTLTYDSGGVTRNIATRLVMASTSYISVDFKIASPRVYGLTIRCVARD